MNTRRISNSEIATWSECQRKWWLAWHRGLRSRQQLFTGALKIGERIHDALALYYTPNGIPLADLPVALVSLLEADRELLDRELAGTARYPDELRRFEHEAELQKIMLEGYVQWIEELGADDAYEVIASEEYVESPFWEYFVFNTEVHLIGRLDVRLRRLSDGKIFFIDHKTVSAFIKIGELRRSPQMKMYRTILERTAQPDEQPSGAIYSQLRKVKRTVRATPPFYQREVVNFNRHELNSFTRRLDLVITEILHAEQLLQRGAKHHDVVYPTPTRDCDWKCPFASVCDMFDDGSRVEDAIADQFVTDNPLSYYDQEHLTRHDDTTRAALPTAG